MLRQVIAPLEKSATWFSRSIVNQLDRIRSIGRLETENDRLHQQVVELTNVLRSYESFAIENDELRRLLDIKEQLPIGSITARVIARNYNHWFDYVVIDRGSSDGVKPGLPVVDAHGAVGHIENVTANTAKVILLTDTKSAVGGVVHGRDIPVLVEGTGDPSGRVAALRSLVAGTEMRPGDLVITSGLSLIFPAGVPIGIVSVVEADATGLRQRASLSLLAKMQHIDWVTVLLDPLVDVSEEIFGINENKRGQ